MFTTKIEKSGRDLIVTMVGSLSEDAELPHLPTPQGGRIVIDLGGLKSINSLGCRSWTVWIRNLGAAKHTIELRALAPAFVNQVNILAGLVPVDARITSVYVPYSCVACGAQATFLLPIAGPETRAEETVPCSSCESEMEIDVDQDRYLGFMNRSR